MLAGIPELINLHPSGASNPSDFVQLGELTFFTASDGTHGRELWKTDGTPEGTVLVKDILAGSGSSDPSGLVAFQGHIYFAASDGTSGRELWRSDGTAEGTVMVRDIHPGEGYQYPYGEGLLSSLPRNMVPFGNRLMMSAEDAEGGAELWSSDGTAEGTTLVKDIAAGSRPNAYGEYPKSSSPQQLIVVGDTLYFTADDGEHGRELWKSDGTAAGTVMVKDIFTGTYPYYYDGEYYGEYPNQSRPGQLTAFNGQLFFTATDGEHGTELWKSDGTADGTVLVKDINPGTASGFSGSNSFVSLNGRLLFAAETAGQGKELWSSDGTEAGTTLVNDIRPGSAGGITTPYLTVLGESAFFAADDGTNGNELWRTDGTEAGTVLVSNIDGSASGSFPRYLTAANGRLYFSAFTPALGREIWESDGTSAGTVLVADLATGTASSTPRNLFAFDSRLLFSADNGTDGRELYIVAAGEDDVPAEIDAQADQYEVSEDGTLTVTADNGVLANDGEDSSTTLTATLVAAPEHGDMTLNADGSFTYTPDANFAGTDSFTYRAVAGDATSETTTVTIEVQGTNDPPEPAADTYGTPKGTALTVNAASGVLNNDVDIDGDSLTVSLANQPTHGTLTLNANGSFTYTPDADFTGTDSFAYRVSDGTVQSDPVSVTINVTPASDVPSAVADSYTVNEDAVLNVSAAQGVLANDSVPTGNISVTVTQSPSNGTLTFNQDGSFTYTPNANFAGLDSFTYRITRGNDQSTAAATITVVEQPDPPTATNDNFTVPDDGSSHILDVLANDSFSPDTDDSVRVVSVTQGSQGGSVTLSNGQVSYRPASGFTGVETFQYTIEDEDDLTRTATVTVTVTDVAANRISGFVYLDRDGDGQRDADELGIPGALITLVGTTSTGTSVNRSMITADDGSYSFNDLLAGTYEVIERQPTALADGAESSGATGANLTTNDRIRNLVIGGQQTLTENNFGERQLHSSYMSIAWFFASSTSSASVLRETMAMAEFRSGDKQLAQAIRSGGTTPPAEANRPPVATADSYTATRGTTLSINAASGVLSNDSDPDADTLTASLVSTVTNGTLTLNSDGSFSYVPSAGFVGTDSFTYRARDGELFSDTVQVTINVTASGGAAPQAAADSYTVTHNTTLTIDSASGLLKNDTDPDGDTLTAVKVTDPANGTLTLNANGSFVYVPNSGFSGTDTFTYRASDGALTSNVATVTLTVNGPNTAPVAANDIYFATRDTTLSVNAASGVLANDDDAQDDALTAQLIQSVTNGTLTFNSNGSFTYVPNAGFVGTDTFTYSARDGALSSPAATVTIQVTSTNTPPVANNDSYSVDEGNTLNVPAATGVLANDQDNELANMTAQLVNGPAHGTLNLQANGSFIYTPAEDFSGTDTFTYRANDGTADSNIATVTITVNNVNDPPVAENDQYSVVQGNELVVGPAAGVLKNDTDPDGDALSAEIVTSPTHGTLTLNSDGSFTYQPNSGFFGADSFTYRARDGAVNSNTATVTLQVTPLNEFNLRENASAGTLVGQLNPTDPELDGSLIFQFESNDLPPLLRLVPDDHRSGSPISTVVLIQYLDLQSNSSRTYHELIRELEDEFVGELLVVRRHFPQTDVNANALKAAIAAEAAGRQGKFDDMVDRLFERQAEWAAETDPQPLFEEFADELGLNVSQFVEDLSDPALAQRVHRDRSAAMELGAGTTPTIFLQGTQLTQLPASLADFRQRIQTEKDQVDDVFRLNRNTGQILVRDSSALDFETTPQFELDVRITDAEGKTQVIEAIINLTDVGENPPTAVADTYTVDEDSVLNVTGANGVLSNDTDPDGNSLLPTLVTDVAHGTLTLQLNGAFTYTPDEDFHGTDSFTYHVSDGQFTSEPTTVTIHVTPQNDPPVAVSDSYTVEAGTVLAVESSLGVLANDSDPDDDSLIASVASQPSHGTLLLAADGTFQYTPDAGFVGTDSFSYRVSDGLVESSPVSVTIEVTPAESSGEGEPDEGDAALTAAVVDQIMSGWPDDETL